MSAARFAIAIVVGAGMTISASADTRSVTDKMPPAASVGDPAPELSACKFWQSLTFRPPITARSASRVPPPLEVIRCAGR